MSSYYPPPNQHNELTPLTNPYDRPSPYAPPAPPSDPYQATALYPNPGATPSPALSGAVLPTGSIQPARGIILKASLIAGAIEIGYILLWWALSYARLPVYYLLTPPMNSIIDGLMGALVGFFTGLRVGRRTGHIGPGVIATLWALLCYGVAYSISDIIGAYQSAYTFSYSNGVTTATPVPVDFSWIPQDVSISVLVVGALSLLGAWLGGAIGRRGVQVTYGADQIGQPAPLPGLGTLVRIFPSVGIGKAVGGGLALIVAAIALFALLRFGLGVGGVYIFYVMASAVIGSIGYMVRAVSRQGQNLMLYTNGIILQTPQGPLGVRWQEIAQLPSQATRDTLITTTGASIVIPSTIEELSDLRSAIQMGVAQARAQGGQVTP